MKFVMAMSGGKDCALALDKMLEDGHTCVAMMVVMGEKGQWSYMHVLRKEYFEQLSESLNIPLIIAKGRTQDDNEAIIAALVEAKEQYGAEALVTGDIDLPEVKAYNEWLASIVELKAFFPLWQKPEEECINELLKKGYVCRIKAINAKLLPQLLLGKVLDKDCIDFFRQKGIDICGERGEYHTVVTDGPIFKKAIDIPFNRVYQSGDFSYLI